MDTGQIRAPGNFLGYFYQVNLLCLKQQYTHCKFSLKAPTTKNYNQMLIFARKGI